MVRKHAYSDLESEVTADATMHNDSDYADEPSRAPALGEVIRLLNVIRSFVECHGRSSQMLRLVGQPENMTLGATNYRMRQTSISDY